MGFEMTDRKARTDNSGFAKSGVCVFMTLKC